MKNTYSRMAVILLSVALLATSLSARASNKPVALVKSGKSLCAIVRPRDCQLSERMARKLSDYLQEHTGATVPIFSEEQFKKPNSETALILLDGTENHRLAAAFQQKVQISSERNDAFHLRIVNSKNAPPLILLAGNTAEGAKFAAYRLMRELEIEGRSASIKALDVRAEPFVKTRSIALFNVWGMPIELTRRHNTESWPLEELKRYLDMYDFFGFNAIESHDRFNDNYLRLLFGLERAQWRDKVQAMCDHAHANGQKFYMRIWGHTVMETPALAQLGPSSSVPKKLVHLCINDSEERARWENEILNYYVTNYAGRIDNLIGHWCDPGICRLNGCNFTTPLKLQMELHNAFKAKDPDFTSSFNLWYFDKTKDNPKRWARGGWADYNSDFDLINAGILNKSVIIATATTLPGSYNDEIVKAIVSAGHKPAVWTWYRADHETRPSLHVHLHERLGEYFKELPASAKQLEWHSIERNVHKAANTANYYVAGNLMWDPSMDVDELLKEFVMLAFGAENADKILPAYLAIENIRCHSCYKNFDGTLSTGMGTANPKADLKAAQAALTTLASVKFGSGFRPRIPLDVSREQMIADLKASLEVIRDYANCRAVDLPALQKAFKDGNEKAVAEISDDLKRRFSNWNLTLAGRQEWSQLNRVLNANKK
jgi:hypothetical protein